MVPEPESAPRPRSRRSFIKHSMAGTALTAALGTMAAGSAPAWAGVRQTAGATLELEPADASYDVLVVGGGPAGLCAAIQAARAGARTDNRRHMNPPLSRLQPYPFERLRQLFATVTPSHSSRLPSSSPVNAGNWLLYWSLDQ